MGQLSTPTLSTFRGADAARNLTPERPDAGDDCTYQTEYIEHRGPCLRPAILLGLMLLHRSIDVVATFNWIADELPGSLRFYERRSRSSLGWWAYLLVMLFCSLMRSSDSRNNSMLFLKSMPQTDFKIFGSKMAAAATVLGGDPACRRDQRSSPTAGPVGGHRDPGYAPPVSTRSAPANSWRPPSCSLPWGSVVRAILCLRPLSVLFRRWAFRWPSSFPWRWVTEISDAALVA